MGKHLLSVSKFAKMARVSRARLHHYDKIGLLSPIEYGENRYRYYSSKQLSYVNLILALQTFGMTLVQIRNLLNQRTPEFMDELLKNHIETIIAKIEDWNRAKNLLLTFRGTICSGLHVDEHAITVNELPEESISLGEPNDYSRDRNDYDALVDFYNAMRAKYPRLGLNYPVWGLFSEERIKKWDWKWPDRYYFYNSDGCDKRPAAQYAIGYTRGGYGQSEDLYIRMMDYIHKNGFEICGPAYEEYPLNEVCIQNETNYLMRVMITVRKQDQTCEAPMR